MTYRPPLVVGGQRNLFVFKLYENTKWFQLVKPFHKTTI